ncbi:hypothetical protein ACFQ8C_11660 [Streptomyces sp. NPDC056503]|uniref:hypothetical protein n=1 Tax=Streptomyces sp. NPDC056503 TaxID=3345842 RepID=UPI0036906129
MLHSSDLVAVARDPDAARSRRVRFGDEAGRAEPGGTGRRPFGTRTGPNIPRSAESWAICPPSYCLDS